MIKKIIIKTLCALLTISILLSIPFSNVRAEGEETAPTPTPTSDLITQEDMQTALLSEQPTDRPEVNGQAFALYDATSNSYILGENIDTPMEPASTTKVMTVLMAFENLPMDQIITITPNMYESIPDDYVKLGLVEGEEISVQDLIYASLLVSANDACLSLAIAMGGTEAEFCNMMNNKAQEIGCTNTTFTTAYGFADPSNLTTAHDMALILNCAISLQGFSDISTTLQYTIGPTNKYDDSRTITNANRFVSTQQYSYEYYVGGKTGFTDTAGHTIVAAATKNGRTLIGVILGSSDSETRYANLISMFDYCFQNYVTTPIDDSEFSGIYSDTIARIQELIVDYNIVVTEQSIDVIDYITTTTARSSIGSTNKVELSNIIIDPNSEDQEFNIPLYRTYADNRSYIIGYIHVRITSKDKVIEVTPDKKTIWGTLKDILITVIVIVGLGLILIAALLFFRKKNMKRHENEFRNRSKML